MTPVIAVVELRQLKNRRRRTTMYPARNPEGAELGKLLARRLAELPPDGLVFPSPTGNGPGAPTTGAPKLRPRR